MTTPKLKNYTTTIPASRTVAEITDLLVRYGAESIQTNAKGGKITGLSFAKEINGVWTPFRVPAHPEAAIEMLWRDYQQTTPKGRRTREDFEEQGYNVAWRVVRDWIHAQLSIIELGMVTIDEVFLPYLLMAEDRTVYDLYKNHKLLPEG